MKSEKFFVVPYRIVNGAAHPGERRLARSESHADAVAERLAQHWAGAVAYAVIVHEVTGEIGSPREVCAYGVIANTSPPLAELSGSLAA